MSNKEKWVTIATKVTESQKKELEERAMESGMTLYEYQKARLIIDQDDHDNSKYVSQIHKRNYTMLCKMYALLREFGIEKFGSLDKVYELELPAINHIKSKGLLPKDYQHPKPKQQC